MRIRECMLCLSVFWSLTAATIQGQAAPSATTREAAFQLGAELSGFDTDVASPHPFEYGVGAYADLSVWRSLGIEAEARTIQFNRQDNVRQDIASAGLRYVFEHGIFANRRYSPYAKVLAGLGSADFPAGSYGINPGRMHDTFTTMTLGAGVDYRLVGRLSLRGEYEYQYWFDYGRGSKPGFGTANPNGFSVGAAYRFF